MTIKQHVLLNSRYKSFLDLSGSCLGKLSKDFEEKRKGNLIIEKGEREKT